MRTSALLSALCISCISLPAHAELYLISRNKIDGTDLTGATFLRSSQMTTMASCEAEIKAARTTGFQIFSRLYVKTHKGFSAQMQLYCAESEQSISPFAPKVLGSYTYLVTIAGNRLQLQAFENLGQCTGKLGAGKQTSNVQFCAKSTQSLKP
ncbi:MAG: hypothetical protein ACRERR_07390 [Moraxellaceae bacterium]